MSTYKLTLHGPEGWIDYEGLTAQQIDAILPVLLDAFEPGRHDLQIEKEGW